MPTPVVHSCKICKQAVINLTGRGSLDLHHILSSADKDECELVKMLPVADSITFGYDTDEKTLWINGHEFGVCARKDDPVAKFIKQRPANYVVVSDQSFRAAREWLRTCFYTHLLCPGPSLLGLPLPKRVVDVSSSPPKLHTAQRGACGFYAALSYCWGGPQPVSLTSASWSEYSRALPTAELPQTIKDAITVTRNLSLRYLWVDALCIIQDSEEDKQQELAKMCQVYNGAYVTISAATARTCHDGFLQVRKPKGKQLGIQLKAICPDGNLGSIVVYNHKRMGHSEMELPPDEPIHTRAWTMQESLLAPRLLIYGSQQLEWRCMEGDKCDGGFVSESINRNIGDGHLLYLAKYGQNMNPRTYSDGTADRIVQTLAVWTGVAHVMDLLDEKSGRLQDTLESWASFISAYTSRQLSVPSDRLAAIAGIAEKLHSKELGDYVAGLWTFEIAWQLLWYRKKDQEALPRPGDYRAPSWSWACVDGAIETPNIRRIADMDKLIKVLSCDVEHVSALTTYTAVKSGSIHIQGRLKQTKLDVQNSIVKVSVFSSEKVILDALEDWTEQYIDVWCLEIVPALQGIENFDLRHRYTSGLILLPSGKPKTYRRVGFFEIKGPADSFVLRWFSNAEVEDLYIV